MFTSVSEINTDNFERFLKNNTIKKQREVLSDSSLSEKIIDFAKHYLTSQEINSKSHTLKLKAWLLIPKDQISKELNKELKNLKPSFNDEIIKNILETREYWRLEKLKKLGMNLDVKNEKGRTLLHLACENNDIELAKKLIKLNSDVNAWDKDKITPLHIACQKGHTELVDILIQNRATLLFFDKNKNKSPLYYLIENGHGQNALGIFKKHMKKEGISSLESIVLAADLNLFWICEQLINELSPKELNGAVSSEKGEPLIHVLINKFYLDLNLLKRLIGKGIDLEILNKEGRTPLQQLVTFPESDLQCIKLLLEQGVNINSQDSDGLTPLHLVILINKECTKFIKLLIKNGADLDILDKQGQSSRWLLKAFNITVASPPLTDRDREFEFRKLLANSWRNSQVDSQFAGQTIPLTGGRSFFGQTKSIELLNDFRKKSVDYMDLKEICELIEKGHKKTQKKPEQIAKQFEKGKTLIFASGWVGHAVQVAFIGDYMLITNRGQFHQDASIKIFKIDRKKGLAIEDIVELTFASQGLEENPEAYFYHTLPAKLGYKPEKQDLICEVVEMNCRQTRQIRGTCWWTSPASGILGLLTVHNLTQAKTSPKDNEKTKKKKYNEIFKSTRAIHKYYNEFSSIEILKQYVERPPDKADRDHQLVRAVSERFETKDWKHIFEKEGFLKHSRAFFAKQLARSSNTKIPPFYRKDEIYQLLENYKKKFHLNDQYEPIH